MIDDQETEVSGTQDMIDSVREEFKENEDLPNTTNPDDWARISGRKGERIINVRTLITGMERKEQTDRDRDHWWPGSISLGVVPSVRFGGLIPSCLWDER